jgi:hypothetical protein
MVTVKSFKNKGEALTYHNLVINKVQMIKSLPKEYLLTFAITSDNLAKVIKNKTLNEYNTFFNKNYLELK